MKKKLNKRGKVIVIAIIALIVLIIINAAISDDSQSVPTDEEMKQIQKETTISKLADWGEQDRIEYYATNFLRNIEYENYDLAYNCLYEEFKKEYFSTKQDFEEYIQKYFPEEIITEYENIERLDNVYVLWIKVKDGMQEKNDFSFNIVIRENDYDDFDLSFSVDSAIEANV